MFWLPTCMNAIQAAQDSYIRNLVDKGTPLAEMPLHYRLGYEFGYDKGYEHGWEDGIEEEDY